MPRREERWLTSCSRSGYSIWSACSKITDALTAEDILHELIGGLAVFVHVEEADPTHSTLTRDVDLMVRREDLDRVKEVAAKNGFRFRHTAGLDMLLYGDADSAKTPCT
jgi:hypothetical protein